MSQIEPQRTDRTQTVLHWYDFIAHPDIPAGGIPAGVRQGSMYSMLEREAKDAAFANGSAAAALEESEAIGRRHGVQGTPAWLLGGQLLVGLRPASEFESLGERATAR